MRRGGSWQCKWPATVALRTLLACVCVQGYPGTSSLQHNDTGAESDAELTLSDDVSCQCKVAWRRKVDAGTPNDQGSARTTRADK